MERKKRRTKESVNFPQSVSPPMTWTHNKRHISYYESRPVVTNSKQEMIYHTAFGRFPSWFVFSYEMRMLVESGNVILCDPFWCCYHACINVGYSNDV